MRICAFCGEEIYPFGIEWYGPRGVMQGPEMCPDRDPLLEGWRGSAERSWLPHEPIQRKPWQITGEA